MRAKTKRGSRDSNKGIKVMRKLLSREIKGGERHKETEETAQQHCGP